MVQLKEVLDRIDLPPMESIPDAQMMAKSEFKYWVIPNTEIRIQRVEKGARAGEYLFTQTQWNVCRSFMPKSKIVPIKRMRLSAGTTLLPIALLAWLWH